MMNYKNNAWKVWMIVMVLLVLPGMARRVMAEDWIDPTRLPTSGGVYRLTTDVTMSDWSVNGYSASLDLNGHTVTITGGTGIGVQMDGMLQITDAKGGGIIRFTGSGALKVTKGILNLDSGTIEGNIHLTPIDFQSSSVYARLAGGTIRGSVYFEQGQSYSGNDWNARMEMLGGTITCSNDSCVQMNDKNAVFNMKGGSIKAHRVVRTVNILSGTFRQSGGEISLAQNITNGTEGVVLGNESTAAEDGSFVMTGGSIRGFTGVSGIDSGYAVYLYNGGSVTMTGGEISGNGVGVRLDQNGAFTMTGGTVSGNSVGVFVSNDAKGLNISGSPKITGNSGGNVRFLPNNQIINISGSGLNSDARIGFWSERISGTPVNGVFTSGLNGNYTPDVFTSDVNGYSVGMNADGEMIFGKSIYVRFNVGGKIQSQNLPTGSLIKDLPQITVPADKVLDGWYLRNNYTGDKFNFDRDTVYSSNDNLNLYARIVDAAAAIGETKYATLQDALEAAQPSETVTLLRDVTLDAPIEIKYPIKTPITLDLNGKTLTRGLTSPTENGHVIHVTAARTLTIKDSSAEQTGRITGGNTTGNGGGILIGERGSLVLEGGEISGNTAAGKGSGVYSGVYIANNAWPLVVRGGKIINNTSTNLYLESGKTISIHQAPADGTNIGVTLADGEGVFAESTGGYNSGRLSAADVKGFVSDISAYAAGVKADGKAYLGAPVTVTFETAGQAPAPAALSVPTGSLITRPELTVPSGMAFSGWYKESSFTNKWNFNSDTVDAALTLYAKIVDAEPVAAIGTTNYNTVQDALDEAVSGDTITLLKNVDIDKTLHLATGKNITLDMAGFRIAQDGSGRIIQIDGGLTLTGNGRLTGGSSFDKGGAVYLNGGSLTLISGTITGNSSGRGGAVYAENKAVFTMEGGTISGNNSTNSGGAVYLNIGGNDTASGSTFTMKSGTISNNTASYGGAVYANLSTVTMEGGAISDNTASFGGAVYLRGSFGYASFTMKDGFIHDNRATSSGGAVYTDSNTEFIMEGGTLSNNKAAWHGGAVYASDGTETAATSFTMKGGEIRGNTAGGKGGALAFNYEGSAIIEGGTITGNSAGESGGGIYAHDVNNNEYVPVNPLTIRGGSITGNTVSGAANNVYVPAGKYLSLADSLPAGTSIGISMENGRGVFGQRVSGKISYAPADYFSADDSSYGVGLSSGLDNGKAVLGFKVSFDPNRGTGTMADLVASDPNVFYGLPENQFTREGYAFGGWNTAADGSGTSYSPSSSWVNISQSMTLYAQWQTVWQWVQAQLDAGVGEITLPRNATAGPDDQALTTKPGTAVTINLNGYTLDRGNPDYSTDFGGGVVRTNDGSVIAAKSDLTLTGPGTITGGNKDGNGGGIRVESGNLNIGKDVVITGNKASGNGGGIYMNDTSGYLSLTKATVSGNSAGQGGGIFLEAASSASISGSTISSNTASSDGGGIYVVDGSLGIDKYCVIENNSATRDGGGVYAGMGSDFVMEGGSIKGNSAGSQGGGACTIGTFTMSGGSITGNSAVSEGGGVYAYTFDNIALSGNVQISGNTIGDSPNNVYLYQNLMINVGGSLEGASVGVHMSSPRVFTSGLPGNGDNSNFFSDYENYAVGLTGAGEATMTESYTVRFDTGSSGIEPPADQIVGSGVKVTEPTLTSEDWFFLEGWYTEAAFRNKWDFANDTVSGNMTLYARFLTVWQWVQHELDAVTMNGRIGIKLPGDAIAGPGDEPLTTQTGTRVTIDLNGYNLDRGLSGSAAVVNGNVITVNGDLILDDSIGGGIITGGNNTGNGGGILVNGGNLTLNAVTISGNKAQLSGGGIYTAGTSGMLEIIRNTVIDNNTALRYGGGIYLENAILYVPSGSKPVVSNNTSGMGSGGGIYLKSTTPDEHNFRGTISGNTAAGYGGGIYVEFEYNLAVINLIDTEITGNTAHYGGGICLPSDSSGTFRIVEGKISGNKTDGAGDGGGIYVDSGFAGTLSLQGNVQISGNTKGTNANNVYLPDGKKLNISASLDTESAIGVSMETPGVFTSPLTDLDKSGSFFSDDPAYMVGLTSNARAYLGLARTVNFVLDKNGMTAGDPDPAAVTVADGYRITAPTVGNIPDSYGLDSWYTDNTYTTKWDFGNTVSGDMTLYARIREAVASLTYRGNTTLYNSVQEAINAIPQGMYGYFLLTLLQDVTIENGLSIDNQIVYFDLAGHTISVKSNFQDGGVIGVSGGGALTLRDSSSGQTGKIIGGAYDVAGIIVAGSYANYSQFRMEGGTIESFDSSAIYTLGESRIIMSGGRIINNNVNNIYPSDTPGGIYFESTPSVSPVFKLEGGNGVISSNTNGDGNPSNVYLPSGMVIEVTAALTGAEGSIGITMENGTGGVFARAAGTYNGGKLTEADAAVFFSDNPDYTVRLNENGEAELVRVYTVSFDVAGHGSAPDSQKVLSGETVTEPVYTAPKEYILTGWYRDNTYTTPWNFGSDTVTGNIILYGKVEEAAAAIGETGYLTVQDAVDAAQTGETVTMLKDVTIGAPVEIAAGKSLTLDLAGKTIDRGLSGTERGATNGNVITVNGNLTLADSVGSGRITGGFESSYFGESAGGVIVNPNAVFTLNGGEIYNNKSLKGSGGIYSDNAAIVMNGGKIRGNNLTANDDGRGAGISLVNGSAFEMNNGEISMNSARYGAGVYLDNSQFTMNNGSVEGNQASYKGGGVYLIGRDSAFTMNGGDITGNYAEGNTVVPEGGGVYVDSGSFILFDGTIHKNGARYSDRSGGNGGGVYITESGNFYIVGGVIQDNSASVNGGGVYFAGATFSVRGGTISGNNNASGSGNNVYLGSGKMLSIPRQPAEGTSISITLANGSGVFAEGSGHTLTAEDKAYFFSDDTQYVVGLNADKRLFLGKSYTVSFNANATEGVTGTMDDQTFIEGEQQALTAHAFHRTGYGFDGWNTVADGTGTKYSDGAEITITENLTLYAQWDADVHTVTFIPNDSEGSIRAEGSMDAEQFGHGTTQTLTANAFTRRGYTFLGWNTLPSPTAENPGTFYADKASVTIEDDLTLYAQWVQIESIITFDANDSTGRTSTQNVSQFVPTQLSANSFTRAHYSFNGWNTASDGKGTPYADRAEVTLSENLTLYAQWLPDIYTIRFHANGGTGQMTDQSVTYSPGLQALEAHSFFREGYGFTAWNTEPDGTGSAYNDGALVLITGDLDLYAQWSSNVHTVTFVPNGGSGTMEAETFPYGSTQALKLNIFTRYGYTFAGWKDAAGNDYSDGQSVTINEDLTLTAQWSPVSYTLIYHLNGGTVSGANPSSYTIESEAITLIAPSRSGYSFSGWQESGSSSPKMNVTIPTGSAGNREYSAVWTANTYSVSFIVNGGTGTMADQYFTYDVPQTLSPIGFTREGFTFVGWNTSPTGTGKNYEDEDSVSNLTDRNNDTVMLYAIWTQKPTYTVTFEPNGSQGPVYSQHVIESIATALSLNRFTREGYSFSGWNTDPNGSGNSYTDGASVTLSADLTLYALWTPNRLTVHFDVNGGTGVMNDQIFAYEVPQALNAHSFSREGHGFTGWNTAADGTGTGYADGQTITLTLDTTLFAQWKAGTHTVTFISNGGEGTMNAETFDYGQTLNLMANGFTRIGHTFTGWNTTADGTGTGYADGASVTIDADLTLYAQWKAHTYTVRFDSNSGEGNMSEQTFTHGVSQALSAHTFTREGYGFTGWNTEPKGIGVSFTDGQSISVTSDMTLYAQWTVGQFDYDTESGAGQQVVADGSTGAVFIVKRTVEDQKTYSLFRGIQVDRVDVASENYTAEPGSVKITLKAAYVATLSDGPHVLTVIFSDGQQDINFSIARQQPSEPMDLTVDVTHITNTGAKGVPADIAQQILELSIFIKEGDTIVSRADGVSLDVFGRFVKAQPSAHFDRKVDFTKGHYTFAVVVTPHEVFSAPPLSQRYSLSAKAWLDNKGEITLYLTWDDGNHSKPELVRIYTLPEDEIGAYHILPDGTKEYLLFHTYDICMAWLGRDDLCRGPERCFHKEHPFVNPFVKGSEVIEEYWR